MSPAKKLAARELRDAAPLFAALGEETRLTLFIELCRTGPLSTTHLSEEAPISRQAVTKHLDVLCDAGLIRSERKGRERIWEPEPERLDAAHQYIDRIAAQWDHALARLKKHVE